jgi:hypothetical protein
MTSSYINKAIDAIGQTMPEAVAPIATFTIGDLHVQKVAPTDDSGNLLDIATEATQQEVLTAIRSITPATDSATATKQDEQTVLLTSIKENTVSSASAGSGDSTAGTVLTQMQDDGIKAVGEQGTLQQHEKEMAIYPSQELLTYDVNMQNVLGTQRLVSDDNKKLRAEAFGPDVLSVNRTLDRSLDEVVINLSGHSTVAFQLSGTWTGTASFFGTIDYQTWYAWSCQSSLAILSTAAIDATANGIWQARVAGLKAFKVVFTTATTGKLVVILNAVFAPISYQTQVTATATVSGSQAVLLGQRNATYEQTTSDTSLREALFIAENWDPNTIYYPGDVVFYAGRNYRCILQTVLTVGNFSPANTTYWAFDRRPARSLVTNQYASSPDSPRLRIEHDLDAYQYRMQEAQQIDQAIQLQNDMIFHDYQLTIDQGLGGQWGKRLALGRSGGSYYNFTEIR